MLDAWIGFGENGGAPSYRYHFPHYMPTNGVRAQSQPPSNCQKSEEIKFNSIEQPAAKTIPVRIHIIIIVLRSNRANGVCVCVCMWGRAGGMASRWWCERCVFALRT